MDRPPRTLAEARQLLAEHKQRAGSRRRRTTASNEPDDGNGHQRLLARIRGWTEEHLPRYRLQYDTQLSDMHAHEADVAEQIAALEGKGITFRRFRKTILVAERRGKRITEADAERIRRYARHILARLD